MQKLTKSHGEHLRPVTLYLEDLEHIVDVLSEVSDKVSISTGDYALEDLKQLTELKRESINELSLSIKEPYVSLDLMPNSIWLYISKDDAVSRGAFEKIKQVLLQSRRPFTGLLHESSFTGLLSAVGFYPLIYGIVRGNWLFITVGIALIAMGIIWFWYGFQDKFKRFSVIIPRYKSQAPSFFKRNSDAILLSIISAIAGGLITLAIVKLTGGAP